MAIRTPVHIKRALTDFVNSSRISYIDFRQTYGSKIIGKSTMDNVLTGSVGIPVLFTPRLPSSVTAKASTSMSLVHNCLSEQISDRIRTREIVVSEADVKDSYVHERLPLHVQYSLQLLRLQPQSIFYNHRHTVLKTAYWELVWEDVVDICALSMRWHSSAINQNKLNFDKVATSKTILNELQSSSIADDDPYIHSLRLVSSTLSDPYLASSAMLNAMKSSEYPTTEAFLADVRKKMLHGLILVWMDRVLMLPLSNPKSIDLKSFQQLVRESDSL